MPDQPSKPSKRKAKAVNLDTLGLEMGNKPPQALEVEEAVLGAMLIEPSSVDMALEELTASSFYDPKNRMIFEAVTELVSERVSVDIVTVSSKLREKGNLEVIGGPVFLAGLSEKVGAAAHIEYYVKILKQKTIQRELITASYEILKDSYDDSVKVDYLIDEAQSKIYNAIQSNLKKDVQVIGSVINDAMKVIEKNQRASGMSGVPSGFPSLDRMTRGWQPSDLIILAARPSVGKTAFALNLAKNAAVDANIPVAIFSLEMSALQLVFRLMTTESQFSADKLKGGSKIAEYEWAELEVRIARLSKSPLYIDDTPSLPLTEFRTKVKRLVKSKGVRLVIVDYLQLMQGPAELRGFREQEVAAISRTLKATAKELNVPIIALSQLSRNAVQRTGGTGKPQLSDLRESGSIEQDADMVMFIHRPDYVGMSGDAAAKEVTQIIIAKHRNGEVGELDMLFKSEQVKFIEPGDSLQAAAESSGMESAMNSEFDSNYDFYGTP